MSIEEIRKQQVGIESFLDQKWAEFRGILDKCGPGAASILEGGPHEFEQRLAEASDLDRQTIFWLASLAFDELVSRKVAAVIAEADTE